MGAREYLKLKEAVMPHGHTNHLSPLENICSHKFAILA